MDITITIGETQIPGRLPYIPTRVQVVSAAFEADQRAHAAKGRRRDSALWELGLAHCASLGVCWAGERLDCPSLRESESVADYGEGVLDALVRRGFDLTAAMRAARETHSALVMSIPTREEVAAAAAPFADPAVRSTGTS